MSSSRHLKPLRLIALAVLVSAGLLIGLVGPLESSGRTAFVSGNWSQVGANAAHTGASRDTSIGPADVGSVDVGAQFQVPDTPAVLPAISHGVVYVPTGDSAPFGGGTIESGPTTNFQVAGPGPQPAPDVVYVSPGRVADEPAALRMMIRVSAAKPKRRSARSTSCGGLRGSTVR